MDVRVFPFSFPPIRGGAQGGVSPTPTPDPTPYPYNVDDMAVSIELDKIASDHDKTKWYAYNGGYYAKMAVQLSGIVVVDNSDVSALNVDLSDLDWTANGTPVTLTSGEWSYLKVNNLTVSDLNKSMIISPCTSDSVGGDTIGVSGDIVINAVNSNGDVLQTITVAVSI